MIILAIVIFIAAILMAVSTYFRKTIEYSDYIINSLTLFNCILGCLIGIFTLKFNIVNFSLIFLGLAALYNIIKYKKLS